MRAPSGPDVVAGEVLLAVENVSLAFGGVKAVTGVSFDIRKGEIRAIIGPNGAGNTSMLNIINGFYRPQRGRIAFRGMTALDNIMAERTLKMRRNFFWQLVRAGPAVKEEVEHRHRVEEIIDFL